MGAYRKPAAMGNNLRLGILLVSVMTTTAVSPTTLDLNATATGVNIGAKLCPVLDAGINITCLMDHGDETGRSYCEMDSSSLNCTSHTYSTAGYYTMWSHCLSEDIHLNDSATIYVGNKIVNMVAMADGQMFKPMPTTGSATVTVTYEEGTHVFLNITNAITGDPIYSGNSTGFSESRVFSPADFGGVLGQHAVEIALSNPLGKETRFVVFDIEEEILTPVMTTNVLPYMHVYDVATFKETMTFGSNIIGAIEFPDIAYVDRKFGQVREMCLNYTWTTTGTFTFDVLFSNMVDSETYPYVVVVQYPVNNITANGTNLIYVSQTLDVKFEMAADALFPMGNLNATIVYGDGTSKVLDISSLTQGASITDSPKSYAPGTYSVELSVFSESSHMNFSWTQYVEYPIQGLELVHVSEAPMSESVQNVSLRMTDPLVSPLLNITCVFDIDGTEYIKTTDLVYGVNFTIIHPFVGDGNKTITFNCSNKLSSQDGVSYMDLYTDCFLDGQLFSPLYKNKDTPVQMYVNDLNMLTAKAYVAEMCRNSSRFYWWTLWKVQNNDVNDLHLQTYYEKAYNQPNSVTITFGKMSMAPELYKVQFLYNLTDIEGGYIIDYVYANFMLPPFIAGIAGGSTRNIGSDAVIQINSKDASYDPLTFMQWLPFTYTWGCRKTTSTDTQVSELIAEFQSQNISIDLNSIGTDCSDPSWPTKGVLPFDAAALADSSWYLFSVELTKSGDSRRAEAIQGIYIMPSTPPTISINCLRNCLPKIAQDTKLILESLCPECAVDATTYLWKVEIFNEVTGLYEAYSNVTAILDTGLDADTLAIKPDTLVFGDILRFTNTVTKSDNPHSATASYVASVNPPPYGGSCEIDPHEGEAAVTLFTIECTNMLDEGIRHQRGTPASDRNEPLKYNVYQKRVTPSSTQPTFSVIGMTSESIVKAVLNVGDPANNFTTDVIVRITDVFHGYTEVVLPVTVVQPLVINDTWSTEDIQEATQSFVLDNLVEARLSNDPNIILQYAESIASVLNQMVFDHQFENDTTLSNFELGEQPLQWSVGMIDVNDFGNDTIPYQELLDNLLEIPVDKVQNAVVAALDNLTNEMTAALSQANVTTYFTIMTAATAFSNAIGDPLITSSASAINAAEALATLTNGYTNLTENKLNDFFGKSDPNIETAANTLFELVDSLIHVTVPPELPDTYEALSIQSTADARLYVDFMARVNRDEAYLLTEDSDITPEERVGLFKMRARIQQMKFKQKQELAEVTMRQAITTADAISAMLQNSVCKGCRDDYSYDSFHVTLINDYLMNVDLKIGDVEDSNVTLDGVGDPYLVIKFTTTKFKENPFIFGDTVSAAAITSDVHRLTLTDVDDKEVPIALVMIIQPVPGLISGSFMPFYTPDDASRCFYHEFIYRKLGDYVCIFIDQEDPEKVRQYDVFVRNGEYPTHLTYDQSTYLVADRDWMSCIAPQHFSEVGITYVGLRPIPIPGMGPYQWTPLNGPYLGDSYNISDPTLNPYNLTITTAGCMTWDKTKESWGGNKCLMDWYPPKYEVECTCNTEKDLTFGNTFFVPPNTIDFSTAFLKFSPQDQAAVLSLLILILLSYIILMIWARHQDKKDIVKWGVTPLMDNNIDDTYYYMVTVYTGMRRDAGTTSRIGFVVSGSEADTGIRELYDGVRRDMGTATVNNFLMTTPHPLGEIDYIYIWHDNSGEGSKASWYLNRVDIEDIQDKQKYFFLCGKWLCMDSADDHIDAVLPVCGKENVTTFENMFFMNTKENLAENHIWVSIFFRPTSSHFTRCQRVTCLMVFIMMSMIANAIYFTPADEFENPSLVRVGPLKFSLQSVYVSVISALISTPSVFLIVLMFRKSKPRTINQNLQDPSLKYAIPAIDSIAEKMLTESKELEKILVAKGIIKADGTILPFWCAYIAWFLSIAGSAVVMFFLMLYSMEWGKQKSEMWLTQFVLSFFEASAILDPVKVVLMAAFFAFIFTQLDKFKPSSLDRGLILRNYRQRFSCPTDIKMPARFFTPETIQEARKERQREMMMARALKECFLTIIFLWIIYSISFSNRDDRSYRVHDIISKHFVYPLDKRPTFPAITTTANYIDWLKLTAFPALFPEYEYNGEKMHWRWRQYYADLTNFRVGPPRLRQVRVVQDEEEYPFFGKIKTYPEYSFTNEEFDDYCLHWKPLPCDVEKEAYSFSYNGWKHTSASSIWGIPVTGYYSTYSGGGYITELDVNWDFSNRTLEELNRLFWFDRQTRAVFLEFTLYSANLNLFTYVMLMAEFPETGGVTTMYTIYPLRIYQHHGNTGVYMIFCEVMFLVFLLGMILKIIYSMVKTKGNFFANAWNVVDFVCVVGGCIGVAMYFGRLILANETMGNFTEDPKNFVNFQHLAFWDLIFVTVLACLVFLSTIRVVGVLGYDKRIGEVFRVVDNCARDLFWFGVMFFYIFMGYCILGYLVFGRNIKAYWNIFDTMGTLFISMIGKSKFTELNEQDPLMAQLYFFTYILLIVYVLLTMFLAILCDSIAVVHAQTKNDRSEELIAFMIEQLKKFFSSSKKKREAQKLKSESGLGKQKPIELLSDLRLNLNDIMKTLPEKERNPFMK